MPRSLDRPTEAAVLDAHPTPAWQPTPAVRAGPASANPWQLLTPRERQIVELVAAGCVNKQVAAELDISEYTVSTHLRRIFAKLQVDTRAAMVFRCSKALVR